MVSADIIRRFRLMEMAKSANKAVSSAIEMATNHNPGVAAHTSTATPASTNATARKKRAAEKASFTGWDNDPGIRSLQEKWWAIYVDTGLKNTPEQAQLNQQAQTMRVYNNPMYDPSITPSGPADWMAAEKITPRDTTPGSNAIEAGLDAALDPSKFGGYVKAGAGLVFLFVIVSLFRR